MRRLLQLAFTAVITACGGGTESILPPPPPPPGPAATIAVQAGDNQSATVGTAVPVEPSVIVKDANARPVSGVSVSFAVDSGGGSVTTPTAVTGSDGVASSGGWTLGSTEGRNVLRVSAGSLAPLRIVATAAIAPASFPAVTVGVSGGAVTVTQPGPLNGFSLTLPNGAFATASDWTVSYSSSTSFPRTPGINPITPTILLSSSVGDYANSVMTLTIPATVPAGLVPFIVLRDPGTGRMELIATHVVSPTLVAGYTRHLNGAHLAGKVASGGALRAAAARSGYNVQVIVTALTRAQLDQDYDTQFRPGTDDWDVTSTETMPDTAGTCAGLTISAMWYYLNQKQAVGPLNGRYALAPGVPLSNRVGLRWSSAVQSTLEANDFAVLNTFFQAIDALGGTRDQEFYDLLKAEMIVTQLPQFVTVTHFDDGRAGHYTQDDDGHAVIAWKVVAGTVFLADPNFPGNGTNTVSFANGSFGTYTSPPYANGQPNTYDRISTIPLSQLLALDDLAAQWPSVVDGTIDASAFPTYALYSKYGAMVGNPIWLADTLRLWEECPSCQPVLTSPSAPEASASLLNLYGWTATPSGSWTPTGAGTVWKLNFTKKAPGQTYQYALQLDGPIIDPKNPQRSAWLDWVAVTINKPGAAINPAVPKSIIGVQDNLSLDLTGTLPPHIRYQWDFGDGTAKTVVVDDPHVQHKYAALGSFTITVEAQDPATHQPYVSAQAVDVVTVPTFVWSLRSATVQGSTLPAGGIGSLKSDTTIFHLASTITSDMEANPGNSAFFVIGFASGGPICAAEARLEQFAPGQVVDSIVPSRAFALLAICGDAGFTGGLTMGPLGNGTIVGSATPIPDPNRIPLPGGSVDATMNGKALNGTFVWNVRYSTGIGTYTVGFQAVQVRP